MNSLIPDTLEGALLLSLIDFFLSFVVISFIGLVLSWFPLLNRVGTWLSHKRPSAPAPTKKAPVQAPVADQEIPIEDVVAIAAAIAAMVGDHRILHIEPHSAEWSTAGRVAHHHSHLPKH